jgi:hypothetical protein
MCPISVAHTCIITTNLSEYAYLEYPEEILWKQITA